MRFLHTRLVTAAEFAEAYRQIGGVYFIRNARDDTIKIGYSRDVFARFSTLQVANSSSLALVGLVAALQDVERSVHQQFPDGHARGEWFYDSGVITGWLNQITQGHPIGRHIWRLRPARMFYEPPTTGSTWAGIGWEPATE